MKIQFKSVLCAVALTSFAAGVAFGGDAKSDAKSEAKSDAKPDAEGYVRDWLMLAPIALEEGSDASELIGQDQIAKEAAVQPKDGDKVKVNGKELVWKSVHSKEAHFDFNEILGSANENVAGYMVAYVVCEKELPDLTLLVGSNDQGRLYLNGKEVFKYTDSRVLEKDSDKVENLTLKKGVNTIVFKVINGMNNWQGCARFTDKSGKPVTNLAVKQAP